MAQGSHPFTYPINVKKNTQVTYMIQKHTHTD